MFWIGIAFLLLLFSVLCCQLVRYVRFYLRRGGFVPLEDRMASLRRTNAVPARTDDLWSRRRFERSYGRAVRSARRGGNRPRRRGTW